MPASGNERERQLSRTVLGVLVSLVFVAVALALWFLVFDRDDSTATGGLTTSASAPTPLALPTVTPLPVLVDSVAPPAAGTTTPLVTPTALPAGLESCSPDRAPSSAATYVVNTGTTPLNQRAEPAVSATLSGTFDPGKTGLIFTGGCVVNSADGYVWWQIFNGTTDVWVASDFVSPE